MTSVDAVGAPRFHHQWIPDVLFVERGVPTGEREKLTTMGHTVKVLSAGGVTQAIVAAREGNAFIGVNDQRVPGKAASR